MTEDSIDLSEQLKEIRLKHCADLRNRAYVAEKAALWGYDSNSKAVNDCGVLTNSEKEILYEENLCYARISLVETPIGLWIYACSWASQTCGGGYATSINTATGYKSRKAARLAAVETLIARFEQITAQRGFSEGEAKQAFEIRTVLYAERTPQLALW